jgi:serine/threonine-protein kinase
MEAAENVLRAGDRLDRYELLCPIASGGMATVWLARLRGKRGFEKLFAVKTIRTELVEDARFQEMFLDEARIASGIQHPNVAQILDLGEERDVLFIVMEWVDGDSLAKIRKLAARQQVTIPIGVALRILADACAGLHAAHELRDEQGRPLGIVHRDVSPQNILVSGSGTVKVIDFGIAKAQNRRQGETGTGVVKGKIQYMAPEQVKKGRPADRRTDIWALGVCLHELVTGRLPYDGEDDVEVIRKLLADEAPSRASGLPDPVGRLLDRTLALDPDDRFPTAAGMQRALESAMSELGQAASSEDVAAFVRSAWPDLAERRRSIVARAVEEARDRVDVERRDSASEEVAFAPTIVHEDSSGSRKTSEAPPIALTKRKGSSAGDALPVTLRDPQPRDRAIWPGISSLPPRRPRRVSGLVAVGTIAAATLVGAILVVRSMLEPGGDDAPGASRSARSSGASAPSHGPPPLPADDLASAAPVGPSAPQAGPALSLEPTIAALRLDRKERSAADATSRDALLAPPPAIDAGSSSSLAFDAFDAQAALAASGEVDAAEAGATSPVAPPSAGSAAPGDDDPNNPYN